MAKYQRLEERKSKNDKSFAYKSFGGTTTNKQLESQIIDQ